VLVDVLLDPFGSSWARMRDAAKAAEASGFDGVWTWDHLAGSVHGATSVLECWTTLCALAVSVPRLRSAHSSSTWPTVIRGHWR
jgi:alkanesulfonate monooxygenase SsuD/methylene tetrahydromethanopterin reductase-like flavin-dependent oxidoreductase (luciferase family)